MIFIYHSIRSTPSPPISSADVLLSSSSMTSNSDRNSLGVTTPGTPPQWRKHGSLESLKLPGLYILETPIPTLLPIITTTDLSRTIMGRFFNSWTCAVDLVVQMPPLCIMLLWSSWGYCCIEWQFLIKIGVVPKSLLLTAVAVAIPDPSHTLRSLKILEGGGVAEQHMIRIQ